MSRNGRMAADRAVWRWIWAGGGGSGWGGAGGGGAWRWWGKGRRRSPRWLAVRELDALLHVAAGGEW
jgi:hypothetical protein